MKLIIKGEPRSKKNSQKLAVVKGRIIPIPSDAYRTYRDMAMYQIPGEKRIQTPGPVNLKAVYYMQTRRKVDLVNLLEATCDILVDAGVLEDDNSRVVAGHDGSRVKYDKNCPRVEIEITDMEEL